jgi:hypothetical protein
MTDDRFDELAKALSRNVSRRKVFKGALAAAVSGAFMRAGGGQAEAAVRRRRGCPGLHDGCGPGRRSACCPGMICDGGSCLVPDAGQCVTDDDCCCGEVCRPHRGRGEICQPAGVAGARCVDDADCAAGFSCDAASATCLGNDGTPCGADDECADGVCDPGWDRCGTCGRGGAACASDADCCANDCDPYTQTCGGCAMTGATCASDADCCVGVCDSVALICGSPCLADGLACGADVDCCSGDCDSGTGTCGGGCPSERVCGELCCDEGYHCCGGMCCANNQTCCQSINTGVQACYNPDTECCPGMLPCGENVNYPGTGIPQCCDGVGVTCCNGKYCCPADWICCVGGGCVPDPLLCSPG